MLCPLEPGAKRGGYLLPPPQGPSAAGPGHGPARGLEIEVAAMVALEGNSCVVGAPAVRLHYDALLRPVEVDFVSSHHGVHCRPREAGLYHEVQKAALELVAGEWRLVVEVAEQAAEGACASAPVG